MYLVDTNIFLEVLLLQHKKEECEKLLDQFRKGKEIGLVTDFTVHSIIVIMSNYERLDGLRIFLYSLTAYKGLRIYPTNLQNEIKATELASENKLDMDNAIQYAVALEANVEAIVSFDKHFNNLKIQRKEPNEIT
jgi:predicted nucleic acid-binding protein